MYICMHQKWPKPLWFKSYLSLNMNSFQFSPLSPPQLNPFFVLDVNWKTLFQKSFTFFQSAVIMSKGFVPHWCLVYRLSKFCPCEFFMFLSFTIWARKKKWFKIIYLALETNLTWSIDTLLFLSQLVPQIQKKCVHKSLIASKKCFKW